jgi:hypothetical protein
LPILSRLRLVLQTIIACVSVNCHLDENWGQTVQLTRVLPERPDGGRHICDPARERACSFGKRPSDGFDLCGRPGLRGARAKIAGRLDCSNE